MTGLGQSGVTPEKAGAKRSEVPQLSMERKKKKKQKNMCIATTLQSQQLAGRFCLTDNDLGQSGFPAFVSSSVKTGWVRPVF